MQDNLKMKEYLVPQEDGTYKLHLAYPLTAWKSWIEVPNGATVFAINGDVKTFYKDDGNTQFDDVERILCVKVDEFSEVNDKQIEWVKSRVKSNGDNRKAITVTITPNDVKTGWFKKFLDGVKVQCRVIGTKGWQNMTWKSLEKMKLNLEFREKPTTVEVDGMKFDTVDKLTSYLKSMTNLK